MPFRVPFRAVSGAALQGKTLTRLVLAFALVSMTGCALHPSEVISTTPERDFTKLSCGELESESARISGTYVQMRNTTKAGTRDRYSDLNGEAMAVNDSIRVNDCKLANVEIPGRLKRHRSTLP